jgi:hypothetical protein
LGETPHGRPCFFILAGAIAETEMQRFSSEQLGEPYEADSGRGIGGRFRSGRRPADEVADQPEYGAVYRCGRKA